MTNAKKLLRQEFIKKRNELRNNEMDEIIFNKIINHPEFIKAKVIATYVSFNSEVDTLKFIDYSLKHNKHILVPNVINDKEMVFKEIHSLNDLNKLSKFNIKEVSDNVKAYNGEIDLCIVPGLIFDKHNERIGYGKGYYDRYLHDKKIYTIALAYDFQIIDKIIYNTDLDIKMNEIIHN